MSQSQCKSMKLNQSLMEDLNAIQSTLPNYNIHRTINVTATKKTTHHRHQNINTSDHVTRCFDDKNHDNTSSRPSTPTQDECFSSEPVTPANLFQSIREVESRVFEIATVINNMDVDVSHIERSMVQRILNSIISPK